MQSSADQQQNIFAALNSIYQAAEFMLDSGTLNAMQHEDVQTIMRSVQRLAQIVENPDGWLAQRQQELAHPVSLIHEVRSPLNQIINFSKVMMDFPQAYQNAALTAEQRECLMHIRTSGENLLVLMNDLYGARQGGGA
jgi:signal transduction histidine kinase